MSFTRITALALAAASIVNASPCPFGDMAEKGQLSEADSAKFYKARSEGHPVVENMMDEAATMKQKREFDAQAEFYNQQMEKRQLNLGGGLLNGVLQPFSGILAGLDVPVPQQFGLKMIPGDDPAHQYVRPGKTDVRGMCPTLNTMANHGYISRNGITTFAEAANACQITLGFGYDTCVFLSALGLLAGGDLVTGKYSIGGADARVPNTLGPALGISTHGPFEIDQSISRVDQYFGNQANFNLNRWNNLLKDADKHGGFTIDAFGAERARTFEYSKTHNPNFDAGPKQLAVALAERVFIPRAMPNGTFQDRADFQNIAPFYLNETFPDNWFRRATAYSLASVGTDIVYLYSLGPTLPGHNEGLGNFIPLEIDPDTFTNDKILCFLEQQVLDFVPGQFSSAISSNFDTVLSFFNGAVKPMFASAGCNAINPAAPKGTSYGAPGPSAKSSVLVNGKYQ